MRCCCFSLGHRARYLSFSPCEIGPVSLVSHRDDTIFLIEKDLQGVMKEQVATQAEGSEFVWVAQTHLKVDMIVCMYNPNTPSPREVPGRVRVS